MSAINYYLILEIDRSASMDDVKKAFRTLAKKYHPDHGGDEAKFKQISEAYSTLSNPEKRSRYDITFVPTAPARTQTYTTQNAYQTAQSAAQWRAQKDLFDAMVRTHDRAYEEMVMKMMHDQDQFFHQYTPNYFRMDFGPQNPDFKKKP